tara:strand:- start:655 stop:1749 length:1095 start_codon:yes stop_codon:yes gene_type:complete
MAQGDSSFIVKYMGLLVFLISLTIIPKLLASTFMSVVVMLLGVILIFLGFTMRGLIFESTTYKPKLIIGGILFLLLGIGSSFFAPIAGFFNFLGDITSREVFGFQIYSLALLIAGFSIIISGNWKYKLFGFIFLSFSLINSPSLLSASYLLFFIALFSGLILIIKMPSAFAKILGVLLIILTLPFINNKLAPILNFIAIPYFSLTEILVAIIAIISAIYLIFKTKNFTPKIKTASILLGIFLILFSIPIALDYLVGFLEINIGLLDSYSYAEFAIKMSAALIGLICFLGGKGAIDFAKKGYGIGKGGYNKYVKRNIKAGRLMKERRRIRGVRAGRSEDQVKAANEKFMKKYSKQAQAEVKKNVA